MKIIQLVAVCFLAITSAYAQSPEKALEAADQKFKSLKTYSATMGYVMQGHQDLGRVYYNGPKYHFDYPEDQTIFDGQNIMNWNKAFATVQFMAPQEGADYSAGGIYELYKHRYRFEWGDTVTGQQRRMTLTAMDDSAPITRCMIGLGRKSGLIESYSLSLPTGMLLEYTVIDFKENPDLDPKLFQIDWEFVKKVENGEIAPIEHEH